MFMMQGFIRPGIGIVMLIGGLYALYQAHNKAAGFDPCCRRNNLMSLPVIAILMPGDMGSGVGAALSSAGHEVVTCLAGRSDASPRAGGKSRHGGMRKAW